jgi:hypothetical protein
MRTALRCSHSFPLFASQSALISTVCPPSDGGVSAHTQVFRGLEHAEEDILELPDPETTPPEQRTALRLLAGCRLWCFSLLLCVCVCACVDECVCFAPFAMCVHVYVCVVCVCVCFVPWLPNARVCAYARRCTQSGLVGQLLVWLALCFFLFLLLVEF